MKARYSYFVKISLSVIVFLFIFSCKPEPNSFSISAISLDTSSEISDLIAYKIKEENFRKDSLGFRFKNVKWKSVFKNEYRLSIEANYAENADIYCSNYYLIFSIYPLDEERHLLENDRKKYGFESFSIKLKPGQNNTMQLSRNVKTKIKSARAITISVLEYATKLKSTEIVLQNANQQIQMVSK